MKMIKRQILPATVKHFRRRHIDSPLHFGANLNGLRCQSSFFSVRWFVLLVTLWSLLCRAGQLDLDEFFVVTNKIALGATSLDAPSVNDNGDIVLRASFAASTEHVAFLLQSQVPPIYAPGIVVRSSPYTLSPYPLINNNRSIVSHLSFSQGNQNIYRYDYDGMTFTGTVIARGQSSGAQPFRVLGNIAALDNQTPANLYFYGETLPSGQTQNTKRIYVSATEVTQPDSATTIARLPDVFSTLDQYVASSANGSAVYRGTKSGDLGIYKGNANAAVATASLGFTSTGTRPSINTLNTVAFYGIYTGSLVPQLPGIFLRLQDDASPRVAGNMAEVVSGANDLLVPFGLMPSSYNSSVRTALNDYNQVAFLGVDSAGNSAVFTTSLGCTRKLAAVGDSINFNGQKLITGLVLYNGLGTKGQVAFLANTSDGDQLVLLANRAYNQETTTYSPIVPSYHNVQYLLRSVPNSGFPTLPKGTIGWVGCNLTSMANVLNYFGATISPLDFQNWLIDNRTTYIDENNDFSESAVEPFSQFLVGQGKSYLVVRHRGVHRIANGSNLATIISELRAGHAVKLKVPNNSNSYGHYIIAYGLVDPSKSDTAITRNDILIADPGKTNDFTLADYGQLGSPQSYDQKYGSGWLENDLRVHLYDTAPLGSLAISAYSPIQLILTDSVGRRAGFTSAGGVLTEIPGSDYYEETSYYTLDEDGIPGDPVWGPTEPVKRICINGVSTGSFSLSILGTGSGSYAVSILGNGGLSSDTTFVSGNINTGATQTVTFNLQTTRPEFLYPQRFSNGDVSWTVVGNPANPISVETSTDLINWTPLGTPAITNGVGVVRVSTTNGIAARFLRGVQ